MGNLFVCLWQKYANSVCSPFFRIFAPENWFTVVIA